jgi:hypothetical protein
VSLARKSWFVLGVTAGILGLADHPAAAQQYLPAASAQVASGVEGGGAVLQRARTRLRLGLELRVDEDPENGVSFAGLVDIEPRTALGAELRYVRLVSPGFAVSAGAIGYAVPGTLLGPCAGAEVRLPLSRSMSLAVGPDVTVFAFGSDLPDRIIVWQALFQAGLRVDL